MPRPTLSPPLPNHKIAVFAGDYDQFKDWMAWVYPEDRDQFQFVGDGGNLQGLRFKAAIRIGNYDKRISLGHTEDLVAAGLRE